MLAVQQMPAELRAAAVQCETAAGPQLHIREHNLQSVAGLPVGRLPASTAAAHSPAVPDSSAVGWQLNLCWLFHRPASRHATGMGPRCCVMDAWFAASHVCMHGVDP